MGKLTVPPVTKKQRLLNRLIGIVLVIVLLTISIFAYWSLGTPHAMHILNAPVPYRTIRDFPEADGVIIVKIKYCKYVSTIGTRRTSFIGASNELFLPDGVEARTKGCGTYEQAVLIPKNTPAGDYHIHFVYTYRINPVRVIIEQYDSQPFTIVDHDTVINENGKTLPNNK